jgi:hypothetical protein
LLPVLPRSDIDQKAQTPAQREMVAFVAMRPVYLPNNEIYLPAYQQFRLERAMTICPMRDDLVSERQAIVCGSIRERQPSLHCPTMSLRWSFGLFGWPDYKDASPMGFSFFVFKPLTIPRVPERLGRR